MDYPFIHIAKVERTEQIRLKSVIRVYDYAPPEEDDEEVEPDGDGL